MIVGSATTYKGKLDNGDTMIAVVDETNGMIVIHEYDGTWGASFLHRGEGVSLTDFLLSKLTLDGRDGDYLARKLVPSEKWQCIDEQATIEAHIAAAERHGMGDDERLIAEIRRAEWERVAECYSTNPLSDACDGQEFQHLIVYADTRWLMTVRDRCLPLLKQMLLEARQGQAA